MIVPNIWKNKIHVPNHQPDTFHHVSMHIVGSPICTQAPIFKVGPNPIFRSGARFRVGSFGRSWTCETAVSEVFTPWSFEAKTADRNGPLKWLDPEIKHGKLGNPQTKWRLTAGDIIIISYINGWFLLPRYRRVSSRTRSCSRFFK